MTSKQSANPTFSGTTSAAHSPQPASHPLVGEILLQKKLIDVEQLAMALLEQLCRHKPIGELLLEKQLITPEQLLEALQEQYWRQYGFWVIS